MHRNKLRMLRVVVAVMSIGRSLAAAEQAKAVDVLHSEAGQSSSKDIDWKPLMVIAERQHDAGGKLLPLQSYDETIRRGISFLFDDHLKWFKGSPESLLDEKGQTQMPWVYYSNLQHNGAPFTRSVDRFVSYPAFHHALMIRTFLGAWRYAKDDRALKEAVKLADWEIAHSTPAAWRYGNLPWSTFQEKKPGGFRDKTGLMPDKAAIMALAYLQLHEATREAHFLKAAEAIAATLAARQRENGTWPFRVDPKTEQVIEEYTSSARDRPPTTSRTISSRTTASWWAFNTISGGIAATRGWCCICWIFNPQRETTIVSFRKSWMPVEPRKGTDLSFRAV